MSADFYYFTRSSREGFNLQNAYSPADTKRFSRSWLKCSARSGRLHLTDMTTGPCPGLTLTCPSSRTSSGAMRAYALKHSRPSAVSSVL